MFRAILEASPSFFHVLRGPEFIFEYANEAYHQLVGRRDLIGRPAFEVMPEATDHFPERIAQVMATRQAFYGRELPVQLARTPGSPPEERLIDLIYLPLVDADGQCTRVLGHGTDVTEHVASRRRAEQAERISLEKLSSALLAGRMVAWEWDVSSDALSSAGAWSDVFHETSPTCATGKAALRRVHPRDRKDRVALLRAAMAGQSTWHATYRIRCGDGSTAWLEEHAMRSQDSQPGQLRFVGLTWDVSEKKRAQDALQLAEVRKNDFLATLSHELRNPLAPIRSGLQIVKILTKGNDRLERTGQVMERQMAHLVRLIDDLMEVSRISRGKVTLQEEPLLLGSVLASAIESTWPAMEAKSLHLVQNLDGSLVVRGDKVRLTQVFANLLSNAVTFSRPGAKIAVELRQDGPQIVVIVSDEGHGIDAASLDTVFDLFSQGPSHQMSGGLGIGLALVKQVVELHGGQVGVQSPGREQGSAFTVRLPRVVGAASSLSLEEPSASNSVPETKPLNVLVVDDNQDAADTLATALMLEGHEVHVAYDGLTALDAFNKMSPAVVVLDIGMPQMDGYEVARRIRQLHRGDATYLIALTGWGQVHDREQAFDAGFNEHMTKPANLNALKTAFSKSGPRSAILKT